MGSGVGALGGLSQRGPALTASLPQSWRWGDMTRLNVEGDLPRWHTSPDSGPLRVRRRISSVPGDVGEGWEVSLEALGDLDAHGVDRRTGAADFEACGGLQPVRLEADQLDLATRLPYK
eukprot:scaffold112162_cov45-Phaeocystis_antarctica.AAC.1